MIYIITLEAITEIYISNYKMLRSVAYGIVHNRDDADDIMQSVMLKLVEKPEAWNNVAVPIAFLRRCVRNEAISLWRHKKIAAIPTGDDIHDQLPLYTEAEYERIENLIYIKAYMKDQPQQIQDAFIAYVIDGYKIVDLAKELNMDSKALERTFRNIKVKIVRKRGVLFTGIIIVIC